MLLEPAVPLETLAELNEGLVCLSGCARDGLALRDPRGDCAARGGVRPRAILRRAPAPVRAGRREAAHGAPRPRRAPRRRDGRDGERPCARAAPDAPPGRARRDPLPDVARRVRARATRKPGGGAPPAGRDGRALRRDRPRRCRAHRAPRRAAPVRPHRGARLPLPRLRRRARPGDPAPRGGVPAGVRRAVRRL